MERSITEIIVGLSYSVVQYLKSINESENPEILKVLKPFEKSLMNLLKNAKKLDKSMVTQPKYNTDNSNKTPDYTDYIADGMQDTNEEIQEQIEDLLGIHFTKSSISSINLRSTEKLLAVSDLQKPTRSVTFRDSHNSNESMYKLTFGNPKKSPLLISTVDSYFEIASHATESETKRHKTNEIKTANIPLLDDLPDGINLDDPYESPQSELIEDLNPLPRVIYRKSLNKEASLHEHYLKMNLFELVGSNNFKKVKSKSSKVSSRISATEKSSGSTSKSRNSNENQFGYPDLEVMGYRII